MVEQGSTYVNLPFVTQNPLSYERMLTHWHPVNPVCAGTIRAEIWLRIVAC